VDPGDMIDLIYNDDFHGGTSDEIEKMIAVLQKHGFKMVTKKTPSLSQVWIQTVEDERHEAIVYIHPVHNTWELYWAGTGKGIAAGYTAKELEEHLKLWLQYGKHNASVDIHETPKMLPPRNDLRRHLDEDIKKEIEDDIKTSATYDDFSPENMDYYGIWWNQLPIEKRRKLLQHFGFATVNDIQKFEELPNRILERFLSFSREDLHELIDQGKLKDEDQWSMRPKPGAHLNWKDYEDWWNKLGAGPHERILKFVGFPAGSWRNEEAEKRWMHLELTTRKEITSKSFSELKEIANRHNTDEFKSETSLSIVQFLLKNGFQKSKSPTAEATLYIHKSIEQHGIALEVWIRPRDEFWLITPPGGGDPEKTLQGIGFSNLKSALETWLKSQGQKDYGLNDADRAYLKEMKILGSFDEIKAQVSPFGFTFTGKYPNAVERWSKGQDAYILRNIGTGSWKLILRNEPTVEGEASELSTALEEAFGPIHLVAHGQSRKTAIKQENPL
jgi:hypothetical protein